MLVLCAVLDDATRIDVLIDALFVILFYYGTQWMKDSRGDRAVQTDETEYPCIKCFSTIDAPLEDVCTYLSQESAAPEYNDVVVKYNDIEEISPNAKICWSLSPHCLLYTSPSPRDLSTSRMPSSA